MLLFGLYQLLQLLDEYSFELYFRLQDIGQHAQDLLRLLVLDCSQVLGMLSRPSEHLLQLRIALWISLPTVVRHGNRSLLWVLIIFEDSGNLLRRRVDLIQKVLIAVKEVGVRLEVGGKLQEYQSELLFGIVGKCFGQAGPDLLLLPIFGSNDLQHLLDFLLAHLAADALLLMQFGDDFFELLLVDAVGVVFLLEAVLAQLQQHPVVNLGHVVFIASRGLAHETAVG